jgi:hypothetical protein
LWGMAVMAGVTAGAFLVALARGLGERPGGLQFSGE